MSETITEAEEESTAFDQLNTLLESIEQHPEEAVRNHVRALVYTLLDLHHGALERMVDIITEHPGGEAIMQELREDELVQAVLLVHELMGQPLEERIENALVTARTQLTIYGSDVELVEVKSGVAKLRLFGGSSTANVSTSILKAEIEHALHIHTPDLLDVEYEDMIAPLQPVKLVQILSRKAEDEPKSNEFFMPVIRVDQ
ncbi:MAG: NifU family protein, partial [Pyrinomonadaceae bacterium]